MTLMFAILVYVLLFSSLFFSVGLTINKKLNLNLSSLFFFPVGFVSFLGCIQFLYYPFVYFQLPTALYYVLIASGLLIFGFFGIKESIKVLFNRTGFWVCLSVFAYVGIMVYLSSQRSLGQNSFDTVHYLSMVMEEAFSAKFSFVYYETGIVSNAINFQYDYQAFYSFGAFILASFEPISRWLNPNYYFITTSLFVWVISILFFQFEFLIFMGFIYYLKAHKKLISIYIGLFLLGYVALIYYNSIFTFFGNTYRTWIVALFMFEIYRILEQKTEDVKHSVWLMLISSALIAVSSTGFFLGIILLTTLFLIWFRHSKDENKLIVNIAILILPTSVFAWFYLGSNQRSLFLIIGLVLCALYVFLIGLRINQTKFKSVITNIIKKGLSTGIPVSILVYSAFAFFSGQTLPTPFFYDHRRYDMVWYFFNYEDLNFIIINGLYFISLLFYIIKSKGTFRVYMLGLLILFINPFSSLFVSRFIASVVYYRSFELLFNPFTTILFIIVMFDWIRNKTMNRILVGSLFLWLIPLVITHSQMYYHPSFIPTQAYSSLYRLDSNQMDTLSVLKTKIELENYDQAIVVSQIEGVRGFVPNVITPISNEDIRNIDKYTLNPETSKLLTIFENRDYIGQQIFDTEPDYIHTCQYLMDARVDFVVVDKRQFFVDETGQFIPLYFLVRDCATPVFENTDYFIYQFYW